MLVSGRALGASAVLACASMAARPIVLRSESALRRVARGLKFAAELVAHVVTKRPPGATTPEQARGEQEDAAYRAWRRLWRVRR